MLITIAILLFENYRSNRQELATQPTTPSPSPDGDRVQQAATNDGNGNASVKEDGRTEPNLKQLHYEGRPVNKPRISQRPREGIAGVAQFAIVLTSGAMRGEGDSIKQFTIPARTKRVRFGLVVEDEVAAAPQLLEVELQNGDGLVLLRFSKPDFSLSRNGRRLNLEISKDRLTAGDYQIVLRASASDSTSEISTRYYFRVRDTYGLKRPN
jgi:hypothetical protein